MSWKSTEPGSKPLIYCAQAHAISKWAHAHFGGTKPAPFESLRYAQKVSEALIEKWDPYHVLHTQSETVALRQGIAKHWSKFARNQSCTGLSQVIETHLKRLEARTEHLIENVSVAAVIPAKLRTSERTQDTQLYHYPTFGKSLAEIQERVTEEVKLNIQDLTHAWFEAFQKDGRKLVRSIIRTRLAVDPDKSSPHWILLGSLAALDSYSTYLTEDEFEELTQDLSGVASGVGIRVRVIPAGLMVRQVLGDSPAGRSGELKAGDWIVEVDGKSIAALSDREKQNALKGQAGQFITLKIRRQGEDRLVQLQREEINLEEAKVTYHLLPLRQGEGDVAIIHIPSFYAESGWNHHGENKSAAFDVENALMEILQRKRKIAAIILDMRGNPGGFLEEAVSMAGLFLGTQPVVGVAQGEQVKILRNTHRKPIYTGPLVVALDPDSASASEVLAGALADNGRAVVVAESRTYGKGSVQRLFPLQEITDAKLALPKTSKTGAVKLTTSLFFSPKGISPEGAGVQAHITVGEKKQREKQPLKLQKVAQAALAALDESAPRPVLSDALLRELETKSRARAKSENDSIGKALAKVLRTEPGNAVSPALVEAVAIARDIPGSNPVPQTKN